MPSKLKVKTIQGLWWSGAAQAVTQILYFIISAILARLLVPEDFGLIGMIVIFTGFAALFAELGFSTALIQNQNTNEKHFSSVFRLNIVVGILLAALTYFTAPMLAKFYQEPRLVLITKMIAFNFIITSLISVQFALLSKSLEFRKLAIIEISSVVVSGIVAIYMALSGYGVFALVWQLLVFSSVRAGLLWFKTHWTPKFVMDGSALKELLHYSAHLMGYNIFIYWVRNADNLLIGKAIGSSGLGIYSRAYSTMLLPVRQISATISKVMFPVLSQIQDDKLRVKNIYLKVIGIIALVSFPMMFGLFVVSEYFVLAIFGEKWVDVIEVLQILCFLGLYQSIASTVGLIYNSQGRTDWQLWWGVFSGILTFIAFGIGIRWGVIGIAIAYSVRVYSTAYFNFSIPGKLIGMQVYEIIQKLFGVLVCSYVMAVSVYIFQSLLPEFWSYWQYLVLDVMVGIVVYTMLIHALKIKPYMELKELVLESAAWETFIGKIKNNA